MSIMQFMEQTNPNKCKINVQLMLFSNPCFIEIRRTIKENELMKTILEAAFSGKSIEICPVFRDNHTALHKLQQANIIKINSKNEYEFLI